MFSPHPYNPDALKPNQLQVLQHILAGATISGAASAAGVHRTTVHHWCRHRPEFAEALRNSRLDQTQRVQEEIEALFPSAIKLLSDVLNDPQASPGTRLRAALAVIKYATSPVIETAPPLATDETPGTPDTNDLTSLELASVDCTSVEFTSVDCSDVDFNDAHESLPPSPLATTPAPTARPALPRTPRNQKCPCGSGIKFKKCCLNRMHPTAAAAA